MPLGPPGPLVVRTDGAAPLVGPVLPPALQLCWVTAPSATEVDRAENADEDPVFVLYLNRPMTSAERRVVRRDLPQATLHGNSDNTVGIAVSPFRVAGDPEILVRTVAAISTTAPTLRQRDAEHLAMARQAAAAVTGLLLG